MSGEIVNINDLILEEEEIKTSKGEIVSVDDLDFKIGKDNRLLDRDPDDGVKRYGVTIGRWFF